MTLDPDAAMSDLADVETLLLAYMHRYGPGAAVHIGHVVAAYVSTRSAMDCEQCADRTEDTER